MNGLIKNRKISKIIAIAIAIIFTTVIYSPTPVYANNFFWQGGYVYPYETAGDDFSTENYEKFLVSAKATVYYGNPKNVKIILQRKVANRYINVKKVSVETNNVSKVVFHNERVAKNTIYRLVCYCEGPSGVDVAKISMGIGLVD